MDRSCTPDSLSGGMDMIRSIPNTADIDNPGDPAQPPASLPGLLLPQGSDIVYSTQAPSDSNKQNTKISSKEWASVKNKIRHLYVEERLSIDKLMQTMKEKYSFKATRKQYLSRLVKWGFNRNIKAETMTQIVRIRERRQRQEGKSTVFKYNGLKVDERKIERFIREKLDRDEMDLSTPAGITYESPPATTDEYDGEGADEDAGEDFNSLNIIPLDGESQRLSMPHAIIWALGALRPLRHEELAIACAIAHGKDMEAYLEEETASWTYGVFKKDKDNFIKQTPRAPSILRQFIPTDCSNNLILKTILTGIAEDKYLKHEYRIHRRPRDEVLKPNRLQPWWRFLEYSTLYWPSHLCDIEYPITPTEESHLIELLRQPKCAVWIEILASCTGDRFGIVLSRMIHLVLLLCNGNGYHLVKSRTISALKTWAKSSQRLVRDWADILAKYPYEIYYINSDILPEDNIFRRSIIGFQHGLPGYKPLEPRMEMSFFEEMSSERALVEVDQSTKCIYCASPHYGIVSSPLERQWTIHCISRDTGLKIAEYHGQIAFEDQRYEWGPTTTRTAQLAVSPDGRHLAYEEIVDCSEASDNNHDFRVFTYYWNILPKVTIDGDLFGQCFQLNRGSQGPPSAHPGKTLGFDNDANLVHTCGVYNVMTQTEVHSISPTDFLPDIRSATISQDSTVTAFAQINPGGKGFNILVRNNLGAGVITTHHVRTEIIKLLDISTSGHLLAFLEHTPEGPGKNQGSRYNLVVLDIASGYRHILDSFEGHIIPTSSDNFYDNTSNFPITAFLGNIEYNHILFAFEPANNKGRVWRKSPENSAPISTWKSTWHTAFDATFKPLKFFDNDNSIMGIYREEYYEFSILSADKHHHIAEVRWSGYGLMLAAWSGRFHCCINTECQSEKGFKIAGRRVRNYYGFPEAFHFISPVSLQSISSVEISALGDYIYYTNAIDAGHYSSRIVLDDDPVDVLEHHPEYRFTGGHLVCVSADNQYKLVCFPEQDDGLLSSTIRFKILRDGESNNSIRSFLFSCQYSATDSSDSNNFPSLTLQGSFHPTLPIVTWTIPALKLGFWIADLRTGSRPMFINGVAFAAEKASFSECGRYLQILYDETNCERSSLCFNEPTMGIFVLDFKEGIKCRFLWSPEVMRYRGAYAFSENDGIHVVGFNSDNFLICLRLFLTADENPQQQIITAFPRSFSHICIVQQAGFLHTTRLHAIVTEPWGKGSMASKSNFLTSTSHFHGTCDGFDAPQAAVIGAPHGVWNNTKFRISRAWQYGGPIIETDGSLCHLRIPRESNPQTDKIVWMLKPSSKSPVIQSWRLMDGEQRVLLEREYCDI
ncbi:hypothetical protein H109_06549 [Trichophyton interdigitale MR816]|uniref:Clr5 domain-containing protein n=1 Tax=Trichophyton interdigitale (strain MR816) TaxID=1215338 RepID=A0A059J1E2_TRIIM|nr:hypothetical protein H109_06549 [Trichophyton interdigitale MR816]